MTFYENHLYYHMGELYFESCLEREQVLCDKCVNALQCSRIPVPQSDPNNKRHYLPFSETQITVNDKMRVPINDFAPRANIRKQFKSSFISSNNCEQFSSFSKTFCVKEKHVVSQLQCVIHAISMHQNGFQIIVYSHVICVFFKE